jgi:hypothetical protein
VIWAVLHQSAIKYVDLIVDGDEIAAKITVAPADLTEPLHLAPDAQPTAIAAAQPAAAAFVQAWIAIDRDGDRCAPGPATAAPDLDRRFVAVTWRVQCSAAPSEIGLDLRAFFAQDPRHEAIVRIGSADPIVIRASEPHWVIPVEEPHGHRAVILIGAAVLAAMTGGVIGLRRMRPGKRP